MARMINSAVLLSVLMLALSLTCAAKNSIESTNANWEKRIQRVVHFDVTQFGMPGDQKYIFCVSTDCQRRTVKHLQLNEYAMPPKLIMPDPPVDDLNKTHPNPAVSTPVPRIRKLVKRVKKVKANCRQN